MASAKPLKIGLVVDDTLDKPDGVQQYVLTVGAWLRAQGHDVHYLVGESARQDVANVHSLSRNVKVRFNRNHLSIPLPTSRRALRRFLAAEQFDVLHVQVPYSPWLAARVIAAADLRTAVIGTFHILPYSRTVAGGARLLAAWTRSSLRRFDTMLAVSPAAAEFARRSYGMESTVLPNVFDYARFQAAKPFPSDKPTILFLGRLVARKGCLTLLQAIAQLPKDLDFRVLICGRGPLEAKLRAYVSQHHLTQVEFAGFVDEADKPRYYATADISVFPSSGGESFGIVLIEAMASGRAAVLAGDNPGYRSVLGEKPELLFNPRKPAELAAKLEQYLTDEVARQAAAAWGKSACRQYDVERVGHELLKIYGEALRSRGEL
jgi:phosphatidylinositol alpha-mannosyltransferase